MPKKSKEKSTVKSKGLIGKSRLGRKKLTKRDSENSLGYRPSESSEINYRISENSLSYTPEVNPDNRINHSLSENPVTNSLFLPIGNISATYRSTDENCSPKSHTPQSTSSAVSSPFLDHDQSTKKFSPRLLFNDGTPLSQSISSYFADNILNDASMGSRQETTKGIQAVNLIFPITFNGMIPLKEIG